MSICQTNRSQCFPFFSFFVIFSVLLCCLVLSAKSKHTKSFFLLKYPLFFKFVLLSSLPICFPRILFSFKVCSSKAVRNSKSYLLFSSVNLHESFIYFYFRVLACCFIYILFPDGFLFSLLSCKNIVFPNRRLSSCAEDLYSCSPDRKFSIFLLFLSIISTS